MRHTLHIDEEHIKAICRSRRAPAYHLLVGGQKVPRPIRQSIYRLAELDRGTELKTSPSTVPLENEGWLPSAVAKAISLNFTTHIPMW